MNTTNYDKIAHIYNDHFGTTSSTFLLPIMDDLFLAKMKNGAKLLDLCCGTGQIASSVSKDGFHVTGLDISKNMINFARKNAPNAEFHVCDIRDISVKGKFNGVYSLFNGINNILTIEDLGRLFSSVFSRLTKDGIFFFDINDEVGFENNWKGCVQIREQRYCYMSNKLYDKSSDLGKSHVTLLSEAEGDWIRSDVELISKHYSVEKVKTILKKARFREVTVFDAKTDLGIRSEEGRKFFLCKK